MNFTSPKFDEVKQDLGWELDPAISDDEGDIVGHFMSITDEFLILKQDDEWKSVKLDQISDEVAVPTKFGDWTCISIKDLQYNTYVVVYPANVDSPVQQISAAGAGGAGAGTDMEC